MKNTFFILLLLIFSCSKEEITVTYESCVISGQLQTECFYISSTHPIPVPAKTLEQKFCLLSIQEIQPTEYHVITVSNQCDHSPIETMEMIKNEIIRSYN